MMHRYYIETFFNFECFKCEGKWILKNLTAEKSISEVTCPFCLESNYALIHPKIKELKKPLKQFKAIKSLENFFNTGDYFLQTSENTFKKELTGWDLYFRDEQIKRYLIEVQE